MNKILLIIIISFGIFNEQNIFGQSRTIDSLNISLLQAKNDTARVKTIILLGEEYVDKFDTALSIFDKGLEIIEKTISSAKGKTLKTLLRLQAEIYNDKAYLYNHNGNIEKAIEFNLKSLKIREEINDKLGISISINNLGYIYIKTGNTKKAIDYYERSLKISNDLKDKKKIIATLINLAHAKTINGETSAALDYYREALMIVDLTNQKYEKATILINIGLIYSNQKQFYESLEYYKKAIVICEEYKLKRLLASAKSNMGKVLIEQGKYLEALDCLFEALKIVEEINEKEVLLMININIGSAYQFLGNLKLAFEYYQTSLKKSDLSKNKIVYISALTKMAEIYLKQDSLVKAEEFSKKALITAKELGYAIEIQNAANLLKDIYEKQRKPEEALQMFKLFTQMKDSLSNEELKKLTIKKQMQYEYEKLKLIHKAESDNQELIYKNQIFQNQLKFEYDRKQRFIESEREKRNIEYAENLKRMRLNADYNKKKAAIQMEIKIKETQHNSQVNQQRIVIYSVIFILIILLISSIFIYNRWRIAKKQKAIIEKQKVIVEDKNREITQSIKYALRIQTAIIPPQKIVKQYLENSFILYKPKDIVAGDFYWMDSAKLEQNGEEVILFAACDCTGHGVPGAMVSVVCHNALNRAVREFGLTQPAAILDKTAEIVLENFSKSEEEIQDGMDISICALNTKTRLLEWAGANNPLWFIHNGILIENKADKQCIGHNDNVKPFTNHKFKLESNTNIYLFSDGFADQFGGQPERKLTKNRFKELLVSIQHLPIQQQATELDNFITNYKQDIEQTDDILVIGVRV